MDLNIDIDMTEARRLRRSGDLLAVPRQDVIVTTMKLASIEGYGERGLRSLAIARALYAGTLTVRGVRVEIEG